MQQKGSKYLFSVLSIDRVITQWSDFTTAESVCSGFRGFNGTSHSSQPSLFLCSLCVLQMFSPPLRKPLKHRLQTIRLQTFRQFGLNHIIVMTKVNIILYYIYIDYGGSGMTEVIFYLVAYSDWKEYFIFYNQLLERKCCFLFLVILPQAPMMIAFVFPTCSLTAVWLLSEQSRPLSISQCFNYSSVFSWSEYMSITRPPPHC